MRLKALLKQLASPGLLRSYHRFRAYLAAVKYSYPAADLFVIGVTGTKGKTTVCHLINEVLKAAGKKTAMLTTIDFEISGQVTKNALKMTTPDPFMLNRFLAEAKNKAVTHVVLEVSSHAIDQERTFGIPFKAAVFTNLSHDHLDYHGSMSEYKAVKARLWQKNELTLSVINKDDSSWSDFLRLPADKKILYGLDNLQPEEGVTAKKIQMYEEGSRFTVITKDGQVPIELKLPGKFNIENALAAFSIGYGLKFQFEAIKQGLQAVTLVPGRMERLITRNNVNVIIDYAHNPDSLKRVYETVKPITRGRLISVLGACGNRDKTKRPIMGALAGNFADVVIITNEDPYDEKPEAIIEEVAGGVAKGDKNKKLNHNFFKILDRREAVKKALSIAKPSDLILLTGKGAEEAIVWANGHKTPWSEKNVVLELDQELNSDFRS